MTWPLIPIALTFAALLVGHIKDWREHDLRKRWFAIALGMIGLASAIASGVGVVKGSHDADKMSGEMSALREQLEIANQPKPKAALAPTFWTPALPSEAVTGTLAYARGDSVHVDATLENATDVLATNISLWITLCDECTFLTEPPNSCRPDGTPANKRNLNYPRLEGRTFLGKIPLDIRIPDSLDRFTIAFTRVCDTCIPHETSVLTVNVVR
jgi:hypothetical protein